MSRKCKRVLSKAKGELAKLEVWLEELAKEIQAKEQAAIDEPLLQQEIQELKKQLKAAKTEQQTCEAQKEHYEKQLAQIEPTVQAFEQTLSENSPLEQLQLTLQDITQKIEQWQAAIQYKELQEQQQQMTAQFKDLQRNYEEENNRLSLMKEAGEFVSSLTTYERIQRFLQHYMIQPSHVLAQQIGRLQHLEDAKDL